MFIKNTSAFPFRRHALALALALATGVAPAATINVGGGCTLVNAINNANSDTDIDGTGGCSAGSGADILALEANAIYTLTEVNNTNNGENGLPVINSTITINGNSATIERSSTTDTPDFRFLYITTAGNLTINQLKLAGGKLDNNAGGGIYNRGDLNMTDSIISGNSANAVGGISNDYGNIKLTNCIISGNSAVHNGGIGSAWGTVTLINSMISDNIATYGAGGIITIGDGITLTNSTISGNTVTGPSFGYGGIRNLYGYLALINSTISGNSSPRTGGIWSAAGTIELINSTISNNSAPHTGGIWSVDYGVTLINSTISGNTSNSGGYGGIFSEGSLTLTNSVIANSSGGADCFIYSGSSSLILQGVNLIEDGSCGAPISGDPKLRPLLDNGGLTHTHALPDGSPAVSAADPTFCEATDQRNIKRPPSCDLGAFERKTRVPGSVAPLVQFLDDLVASGGISGNSPGQKLDQRIALRNQLLTAGEYRNRHLKTDACDQLTRTLEHIVTDNTPDTDDYVTGSSAGLLIDEINALRSDWTCS